MQDNVEQHSDVKDVLAVSRNSVLKTRFPTITIVYTQTHLLLWTSAEVWSMIQEKEVLRVLAPGQVSFITSGQIKQRQTQ